MDNIHIKFTKTHRREIHKENCPDCKKDSFFLSFFENWYGWDKTCLRCGRRWSDGEWMPLNFYRYARRDSIEAAKKRWRRGVNK